MNDADNDEDDADDGQDDADYYEDEADGDEDSCPLGRTWLISGCQWIHLVPLDQRRRRLLNTQHWFTLLYAHLVQHFVLCVLYTPCSSCYVYTLFKLLCVELNTMCSAL